MAERRPAKDGTQTPGKAMADKASQRFTDDERAAMRERARELKAAGGRGPREDRVDGERDVLPKIAEMPAPDRAMAERFHAIIKASDQPSRRKPGTGCPRMPRTAMSCASSRAPRVQDGCATLSFSDEANVDEGGMGPTAFALSELTAAEEVRISALVKRSVS